MGFTKDIGRCGILDMAFWLRRGSLKTTGPRFLFCLIIDDEPCAGIFEQPRITPLQCRHTLGRPFVSFVIFVQCARFWMLHNGAEVFELEPLAFDTVVGHGRSMYFLVAAFVFLVFPFSLISFSFLVTVFIGDGPNAGSSAYGVVYACILQWNVEFYLYMLGGE